MNIFSSAPFGFEPDYAIDGCMNRMILAHIGVFARMKFGAALTHDNVSGNGFLPAVNLDAQPFAFRLASVFGTTYTFLMCHNRLIFELFATTCELVLQSFKLVPFTVSGQLSLLGPGIGIVHRIALAAFFH